MRERFRLAIGVLQQGREMDVSIEKIGTQRNRAPKIAFSVRLLAGQYQRRGQIEMSKRRIWRTLQDQIKLLHRFVETPQRPQSSAEVGTGFRITGIESYCPFEAGQCIRKCALGRENHAMVVVCFGEIRIEHYGP